MRFVATCVLVYVVLLGSVVEARAAESTDALMQQIRVGLASYEFSDEGTLGMLRNLTDIAAQSPDAGPHVAEARFLRAAVAADLYFAAAYDGEPERFVLLAEAFGAPAGDLAASIQSAVDDAAVGIYAGAAERARAALTAAQGGELAPTNVLVKLQGTARDAAMLRRVVAALDEGEGVASALGRVGHDYCGGVGRGCSKLQMLFDAPSRRIIGALSDLGSAMGRVRRAAGGGDPLSALLLPQVESDFGKLLHVPLSLTPLLDPRVFPKATGPSAVRATPDMIVQITPKGVQYGYVPSVHLDDEGKLTAVAAGEPTLPQMATIPLPSTFRPFIRPIREVVVPMLPVFEAHPNLSVGVTMTAGLESHVVARTLVSLTRAGCQSLTLVGSGEHAAAYGVPLQVVSGPDVDALRPVPTVRLRVRLGGYSLGLPAGTMDIPRVRDNDGFRFDVDELEAQMRVRRNSSTSVSFMADVPTDTLLTAMWHVAPEARELLVLLP